MKKIFSLLAVLSLIAMVSGSVLAEDFSNDSKTATASFRSGEISFSANLYNWNSTYTGSSATSITWTTTDLDLGSATEQFKCADVYALIESNITVPNTKVYIFQDNVNNTTSDYVAISSRSVENVWRWDGLVKKGGNDYATLTYMCVTKSSATANITSLPTAWPSWEPYDGVRRFIDKSNSDWATQKTGGDVIIATTDGTWIATTGEWGPAYRKEPVVMFFGAQFKNVLGGDTFGTNTITFNVSVD